MARVADEMCLNLTNLSDEERNFLLRIANYKKHRVRTLIMGNYYDVDHSAKRSYVARVLLGLY